MQKQQNIGLAESSTFARASMNYVSQGEASHSVDGRNGATFPRQVSAQTALNPDAALTELIDGNKRLTSRRLTAREQDLAILKQNTVEKQEPFAAVLSCTDSRVPVEIIFDQSIGHIFVTRVAGNFVIPEIIASLE